MSTGFRRREISKFIPGEFRVANLLDRRARKCDSDSVHCDWLATERERVR